MQDVCNSRSRGDVIKSEYLSWKENEMYDGESSSEDECDSENSEDGELQIVRI